jgi:hypothetical protein
VHLTVTSNVLWNRFSCSFLWGVSWFSCSLHLCCCVLRTVLVLAVTK